MRSIFEDVVNCNRCCLYNERKNIVIGEGNLEATMVFIGEAPGRREDETGRPFVGAAGKLLNHLLSHIGLRREDVYIGNIVKCRPPKNRRPRSGEVKACLHYVEEQLRIITPRIIAPMGNSATVLFMRWFNLTPAPIGKVHGRQFKVKAPWGWVLIFPLYHPAAALYNKDLKMVLKEDFEFLVKLLDRV